MSLYNRAVSVVIGEPGSLTGILIKDLKVTFKIKKTEKSESNTAEIDVYNLSEVTRNKIKKLRDIMILSVGYLSESDVLTDIYSGDITNINHIKNGPDWITKLEGNDGEKELTTKKIRFNFAEGTGAKHILSEVISALELPKDFVDTVNITDAEFGAGFTFNGLVKDAFNKLAEKLNFKWSVQDRKLQILTMSGTNNKPKIFLSPSTGLIGSPEHLTDLSSGQDASGATDKRPGWRVNSLLYAGATIGGKIEIESHEIKKGSNFRIVNIEHNGDTHGNDWNTSLDVEEI